MSANETVLETERQEKKQEFRKMLDRRSAVRCNCGHTHVAHLDGLTCLLCREQADLKNDGRAPASSYCLEFVPAPDRRQQGRV
jgi:hypothetical protein